MTTTQTPGSATVRTPPRRRLSGRFSSGHVVMVTAGLLAAVLNYAVLRAQDDTVTVAVPAQPLAAGDRFEPGGVRFAEVGVGDDTAGRLVTPAELADLDGWIVATGVEAGDLLRRSDLRPPSAPDDRRAMSVPVPIDHAVGGELAPGDRVDVIAVRDGEAAYVLTGAEVLAVGSPAPTRGLAVGGGFFVTLAVDETAALRIATALHGQGLEIVRSTGAPPMAGDGAVERDEAAQ